MSEDVLVFTTAGATGICGWSQGCCSTLHNAQHRPPQQGMVQPQGQQGRLWGHVSGEGPLADSAQEFPHISRLQRTAPPSVQDSQLRARRCTWSRCQADIRNKAAVALGGSSYGESHRPRAAPLLSVLATETDRCRRGRHHMPRPALGRTAAPGTRGELSEDRRGVRAPSHPRTTRPADRPVKNAPQSEKRPRGPFCCCQGKAKQLSTFPERQVSLCCPSALLQDATRPWALPSPQPPSPAGPTPNTLFSFRSAGLVRIKRIGTVLGFGLIGNP